MPPFLSASLRLCAFALKSLLGFFNSLFFFIRVYLCPSVVKLLRPLASTMSSATPMKPIAAVNL